MRHRIEEISDFLYRDEEDNSPWMTGFRDWAVILAFLILTYFFVRYYKLQPIRLRKQLYIFISIALLVTVVRRFLLKRDFYDLEARIPLFSCNISAIFLAVNSLLFFLPWHSLIWQALVDWSVFAGIYGGALAIIFASPGNYAFPHMTRLGYYVEHAGIFFLGLMYIFERTAPYSYYTLLYTSLITLSYLYLMHKVANPKLGTNYGFITEPPRGTEFLARYISKSTYQTICLTMYLACNALAWYCANQLI